MKGILLMMLRYCVLKSLPAAAAAAAILVLAGPHGLRARPARAGGRKVSLYFYVCGQSLFKWTWEDVRRPGERGLSGMDKLPVVAPPAGSTVGQALRFLRPQVPGVRIWRDAANRQVVHFEDRRLLAWAKYPLDKKLTFHGTMSILQLDASVLRRLLPQTDFYYGCEYPPGLTSIPMVPHLRLLKIITHFNVRAVSLRRFLTDGMPYRGGPYKGRELWEAETYEDRTGKFTGRVDVFVTATPRVVPAVGEQLY